MDKPYNTQEYERHREIKWFRDELARLNQTLVIKNNQIKELKLRCVQLTDQLVQISMEDQSLIESTHQTGLISSGSSKTESDRADSDGF